MKNTKKLYHNEKGLVSIIVTLVLIIVMTLVVLAMSQNSNREQRQALDRQLSDQAFYNAESGINDWADFLYNTPGAPPDKTDCNTSGNVNGKPFPVPDIGTDGVNNYTCILYDKAPTTIEFDNLSTGDSNVVPIEPANLPLGRLILKWKAKDGVSTTTGCPTNYNQLPQGLSSTCNVGGIRIDLVDPDGDRGDILNRTFPAYLLPVRSGGSNLTYSAGLANQGQIGQGICTAGECSVTVNMLIPPSKRFYLHLKSLYADNDVSISGLSPGASGQPIKFNNAQTMIDSTGKANDVLRRVQVRLPAQSQYEYPGSYAIKSTQHVCKLITVNGDGTASNGAECPN